ncbi:MAG: CotH kinase family protein [Bacteroidales bacterium]|nr:CotH kinase family protein [Bacteroidales bacterium]MCF8405277.1 CotH kinase family protein [Bacteroidales bacterium]
MKTIILLTILTFISFYSRSQGLKEIYIECDPSEFDSIYTHFEEDIYIPAFLTYEGSTWSDVIVRIRGDSSREYPKKSLKVESEGEPFFNGVNILNFNAEYHDLSYMHGFLSSILYQKAGIDCAHYEHVRLYLNGNFFGLYLMTENMDVNFLSSRGINETGNLYKASKDGACLSVYDNIFYQWELKLGTSAFKDDLARLIHEINFTPNEQYNQFISEGFFNNELINFIAVNMLLSNGSTYYHNYYMYNETPESHQWHIFPWDLDRTFSDYGQWLHYTRSSGYWTPDNPLLERSILNQAVLDQIKNRISDLRSSFFNDSFLYPLIDSLQIALESSVLEDTTDNIQGISDWYDKIALDKDFILDRYANLLYQIDNHPRNFQNTRHNHYYVPGENITFEWSNSEDPNNNPITYSLFFGKDIEFLDPETVIISGLTSLEYTTNEISEPGKYYWKTEASNQFYTIVGYDSYNTFYIDEYIPSIVINEINYNANGSFDPNDWIELYNPDETDADLSAWTFKDEDNGHQFTIPAGTIIEGKNYLVLCRDTSTFHSFFPSSINAIGDLGFGLSSNGELMRLYHSSGYLVDSLVYRVESPWPEEPNGSGATLELINPHVDNTVGWNWKASDGFGTPGSINSCYSPDGILISPEKKSNILNIYPNPFYTRFYMEFYLEKPEEVVINIFNVQLTKIFSQNFGNLPPGNQIIEVDLPTDQPGNYLAIIYTGNQFYASQIVIRNDQK